MNTNESFSVLNSERKQLGNTRKTKLTGKKRGNNLLSAHPQVHHKISFNYFLHYVIQKISLLKFKKHIYMIT